MLSDKFNNYNQARLVTAIKRNGEDLKWTGVRIQRMLETNRMDKIFYDFSIPELNIKDAYLEATIWNNGPDPIICKSLVIEQYR